MNRLRRLLPHVLPAFRKLRRAFEKNVSANERKTFRRLKEKTSLLKKNVSGFFQRKLRRMEEGKGRNKEAEKAF